MPSFSLTDRTVVVTGASAGLGLRFATLLAAAGAQVVAAARRLDRLEELAAGTENIHAVRCDVADAEDREALAARALELTGRFDVLVNNAGIGGHGNAEEEGVRVYRETLEVNLVAPYHLSCLLAAAPEPQQGKVIVNIASIVGLGSTFPLSGAGYAASKGGIIALTRELSGQWAARGIRVNALAPGWFRSEMTQALFADESAARWVVKNTQIRRPGEVSELDGALLYLASDASSYTTGQVLVVDGGWTAR
ncbi:SDR family oxidoreductase [Nakamurella sp. YIM 132087]|uniref:SDR family oxidoreductase n=1 Tax=Nakamurella alba TaxID=2665158 RepID=A0A7K1FT16_9ACTN|nr:SDR family oxidoreductase [Nakamurella alba]